MMTLAMYSATKSATNAPMTPSSMSVSLSTAQQLTEECAGAPSGTVGYGPRMPGTSGSLRGRHSALRAACSSAWARW
jgi:hypothetical protein